MIKFCSVCGSMMNNELCTNKKCALHKPAAGNEARPAVKKAARSSTDKAEKNEKAVKLKSEYDKARRNSKCITYSIDELDKLKENK